MSNTCMCAATAQKSSAREWPREISMQLRSCPAAAWWSHACQTVRLDVSWR